MGQTAMRSVEEAIEELRRFREMGFRGVMMPGNPAAAEDYDHPSLRSASGAAAVELGLPLCFHILTSRSEAPTRSASAASARDRRTAAVAERLGCRGLQDIIGTFIWAACSNAIRR